MYRYFIILYACISSALYGLAGEEPLNGLRWNADYRYNLIQDAHNCYNYGGTLLYSRTIEKLKVQVGFSLQSKNFTKEISASLEDSYSSVAIDADYHLLYFSIIPVAAEVNLVSLEKTNISCLLRFSLNKICRYTIKNSANNEILLKNPDAGQGVSSSILGGFSLSKKIGPFALNLMPFVEYKIIVDSKEDFYGGHFPIKDSYKTLSQDKFSIGASLGITFNW